MDFFTGDRGWVQFYELLNNLSSSSKTKSAISGDEATAKSQVESLSDDDIRGLTENDDDPKAPLEGYTLEIEKLNQVIDSLNTLIYIFAKANGGAKNTPPPKPITRPKTAYGELLEQRKLSVEAKDMEDLKRDFGF